MDSEVDKNKNRIIHDVLGFFIVIREMAAKVLKNIESVLKESWNVLKKFSLIISETVLKKRYINIKKKCTYEVNY